MSTVAVIPARGGSKRIPRKNIKPFCGKPMIAWSIEAARKSACFDRIIVSTDVEDIAAIARENGAEVPFMRPASLADDYTGTIPVMAHAINWLNENAKPVNLACCIYATAPFVSADDIRRGQRAIVDDDCDYAFAVTSFPSPIQRAVYITDNGRLSMFESEHFNTRSQDLIKAWHDAGQFYWGKAQAWLNECVLFSNKSAPITLPRYRVQDIDTMEDWKRAELLFNVITPF